MDTKATLQKRFGYGMCNPVIRKMAKKKDMFVDETKASYAGIASKTSFFLILAVAGFAFFFVLHNYLMAISDPAMIVNQVDKDGIYELNTCVYELIPLAISGVLSLFAPLFAWLIRPIIPVVGVLYAVCQGYLIGYITHNLGADYKWISFTAFILTVAIVAVMMFLYFKRIVKVTQKFRTVLTTFFGSLILGGILMFIASLIPFTRPLVASITNFMGNPIIGIASSAIYLVIAALFLLVDFDMIENCVEGGMAKKLEWMAAWGLAYTVIYIYFKVLNLILKIVAAAKKND